jgi:hypothetical protein
MEPSTSRNVRKGRHSAVALAANPAAFARPRSAIRRILGDCIALGLVLAALIVGAALMTQVSTPFRLFGYPGLASPSQSKLA